jgi:hypothetical protein
VACVAPVVVVTVVVPLVLVPLLVVPEVVVEERAPVHAVRATVPASDAATRATVATRTLRSPASRMFRRTERGGVVRCSVASAGVPVMTQCSCGRLSEFCDAPVIIL